MTNRLDRNARDRAEDGCVVTFERPGGELVTRHAAGVAPIEGFRELVERELARSPGSLVVCVSTPETIATDLAGRRELWRTLELVPLPEQTYVGRAGYPRTLLHPRLRPQSKSTRSRARRGSR